MIQPASDSGTVNLDCTIMKPLLVEYFFCSFLMLINLNIHLLSYTYKHSSLPSPSQHLTTTAESIIMSKAAPTTMDWWGFEKSQSHPYDSHVTTLIICMVMVHKIWIFKLWLKPVQNWSILLENPWLPEMTSVSQFTFLLGFVERMEREIWVWSGSEGLELRFSPPSRLIVACLISVQYSHTESLTTAQLPCNL